MIHRTSPQSAVVSPRCRYRLSTGVWITREPLIDTAQAFGDLANGQRSLYARLSHLDAKVRAAELGGRLPLTGDFEALRREGLIIEPFTIPGGPATLEASERHDAAVRSRLAAADWDKQKPVCGAGKHHRGGAPPGRCYLGGWWTEHLESYSPDRRGAGWVQRIDTEGQGPHGDWQFDYGTTTMVCWDDVTVGAKAPPPSRSGDPTAKVKAWQSWLNDYGYGPLKIDGGHGPLTAAATARALSDHPEWSWPLITPPAPYPLIRAAKFTAANRRPPQAGAIGDVHFLTLHSIQCPPRAGFARSNASWFAGPTAPNASIHWWVDPAETIRGLEEQHHAWGAKSGPGRHAQRYAIHVEHAGYTADPSRGIKQTDWLGEGFSVVQRSARLAAEIIARWDLLPEQVGPERMIAWRDAIRRGDLAAAWELRGVNLHADWTTAYNVTGGHRDVGGWPWAEWFELVRAAT